MIGRPVQWPVSVNRDLNKHWKAKGTFLPKEVPEDIAENANDDYRQCPSPTYPRDVPETFWAQQVVIPFRMNGIPEDEEVASEPPPAEEPSTDNDRRSPSRSVTSERPDASARAAAVAWTPEEMATLSDQEEEHEPDEDEMNMWMETQVDTDQLLRMNSYRSKKWHTWATNGPTEVRWSS
jgi:hypothetical protein